MSLGQQIYEPYVYYHISTTKPDTNLHWYGIKYDTTNLSCNYKIEEIKIKMIKSNTFSFNVKANNDSKYSYIVGTTTPIKNIHFIPINVNNRNSIGLNIFSTDLLVSMVNSCSNTFYIRNLGKLIIKQEKIKIRDYQILLFAEQKFKDNSNYLNLNPLLDLPKKLNNIAFFPHLMLSMDLNNNYLPDLVYNYKDKVYFLLSNNEKGQYNIEKPFKVLTNSQVFEFNLKFHNKNLHLNS